MALLRDVAAHGMPCNQVSKTGAKTLAEMNEHVMEMPGHVFGLRPAVITGIIAITCPVEFEESFDNATRT